jgi:hypothetical protein
VLRGYLKPLFNLAQRFLHGCSIISIQTRTEAKMTNIIESVATVLEREIDPLIERWLKRVEKVPALSRIRLSHQQRTGHLPQLLKDLIIRLRLEDGLKCPETTSAHDHGKVRFDQGYSAPLLVEESLLLQVTIFDTLRREQEHLESRLILSGVVMIADECDKQLKHQVETFMALTEKRDLAAA